MENERKKIILIQIVAAVLALLILALWIFNLKNVWREERRLSVTDDNQSWQNIKADLSKTLTDLKTQLDQLNQNKQAQDQAKNNAFLNNLLEETKKLASTTAATSTATSTLTATTTPSDATTTLPAATTTAVKRQDCPAYIDCMPSIGKAKPCRIPPGCEGITQIAY